MEAVSAASDFPILSLIRRCVKQPWIPRQGYSDGAAVFHVSPHGYAEGIIRKFHSHNPLICHKHTKEDEQPQRLGTLMRAQQAERTKFYFFRVRRALKNEVKVNHAATEVNAIVA